MWQDKTGVRNLPDLTRNPVVGVKGVAEGLEHVGRSVLSEPIRRDLAPEAFQGKPGFHVEGMQEEARGRYVDAPRPSSS